jgi:hypothetical protein
MLIGNSLLFLPSPLIHLQLAKQTTPYILNLEKMKMNKGK